MAILKKQIRQAWGVASQSAGFLPEGQVTLGLHLLILGFPGPSRALAARCPECPPPAQAETPWGALGGLPANLGSPPRESPLAEEPLASPLRKLPFTHSQQPASARPQHSFDNWEGEELKS